MGPLPKKYHRNRFANVGVIAEHTYNHIKMYSNYNLLFFSSRLKTFTFNFEYLFLHSCKDADRVSMFRKTLNSQVFQILRIKIVGTVVIVDNSICLVCGPVSRELYSIVVLNQEYALEMLVIRYYEEKVNTLLMSVQINKSNEVYFWVGMLCK